MKDPVIEEKGGTCLTRHHDLLWMTLISFIGIRVCVDTEVRTGNDPEWRYIERQIVQVIEYTNSYRAGTFIPEYPGTVWLSVGVKTDSRCTGLRTIIARVDKDQSIAKKHPKITNGRPISD